MYKHALILGKFLPLHLGHTHLIDTALEKCNKVTVLVCSLQNESIPGKLRHEWMMKHYEDVSWKKLRIEHVTDEVQQYPVDDNDENFWDIWIGIVMREMGSTAYDVIFTSEEYGKQMSERISFKYPGIKMDYYDVDKNRTTVPVSGTAVRANPLANWQYLPDVVKPYFMKKIVFVGSESSGKTFTCQEMEKRYDSAFVPEYGRQYTDVLKLENKEWTERDFTNIAKGHIERAHYAAEINIKYKKNDKLLLLDTDVIVTEIWGEIYFRKTLNDVVSLENEYIQKGDLYILMKPDIPWVDDGTRDFPHLRTWHYNRILSELKKRNLNYVVVGGDFTERLNRVDEIIGEFMYKTEMSGKNYTFAHALKELI